MPWLRKTTPENSVRPDGAPTDTLQLNRRQRLELVLARDGAACVWCGRPLQVGLVAATTEHLVPRIKGGPSWIENELAACRRFRRFLLDATPALGALVGARAIPSPRVHMNGMAYGEAFDRATTALRMPKNSEVRTRPSWGTKSRGKSTEATRAPR